MGKMKLARGIRFLYGPAPKVTLLHATPEWIVPTTTRGYTGVYSPEIEGWEVEKFWDELGATKLKAPLEMANTVWLIEDVTRSFTHQIVRYRTASVVQESLRFSIQDGYKAVVMVPETVLRDPVQMENFCEATEAAFEEYQYMIGIGIPVQDARSVLPHGTCTRLFFGVDVRTLVHIYDQRMCCQAQGSGAGESGEWTSVMGQMRGQLAEKGFPNYAMQLKAPWEDPLCIDCHFGASFDRACSYKDRFSENLTRLIRERGDGQ